MLSWLKCFGLGFFLHRQSKEAMHRGFYNFLLGFVFALLFIFLGVFCSNTVPLYKHLDNASEYMNFVQSSIGDLKITLTDGKLHCDTVVDTVPDANGYKFIIDTRSIEAYDDFNASYTDGKTTISAEEYNALDADGKKNFKLEITYTANELILTEQLIKSFEEYLKTSSASEEFAKLDASKDSYKEAVYALYLKTYYPDFASAAGASIPRLRSYYYLNYISNRVADKYLYIFDDVIFGEFLTDNSIEASFYGICRVADDGVVDAGNIKEFIKTCFKGASSMIASDYMFSLIRILPFVLLAPAVCALIMAVSLKVIKADKKQRDFFSCLRVQGIFLMYSAFISSLFTFILSFFVSVNILNNLTILFFFIVLLLRTIAYIVAEKFFADKTPPAEETVAEADSSPAEETAQTEK